MEDLFLFLTLWKDYRHTAAWQGLKVVLITSSQKIYLFMGDYEWTHISIIQEKYLHFSASSQTSSMISIQHSLNLASVLMSVNPKGGIQRNTYICAKVLYQAAERERS